MGTFETRDNDPGYCRDVEELFEDPTFRIANLHDHYAAAYPLDARIEHIMEAGLIFDPKIPLHNQEALEEYVMLDPDASYPPDIPGRPTRMTTYFTEIYHHFLDPTTSGPDVAAKAFKSIAVAAFNNNVMIQEIRTNPLKHNVIPSTPGQANTEGLRRFNLDTLLLRMVQGIDDAVNIRTSINNRVNAGIIFCLAREWTNTGDPAADLEGFKHNNLIIERAMRLARRGVLSAGVVGIDIAGPDHPQGLAFPAEQYKDILHEARSRKGLGLTVHTGETPRANDMELMIELLDPDRIGHGILAIEEPRLMAMMRERNIVVELCPSSNLALGNARDWDHIRHIVRTFQKHRVPFVLSTDWSAIIRRNSLQKQYQIFAEKGIMTPDELRKMARLSVAASFTDSNFKKNIERAIANNN